MATESATQPTGVTQSPPEGDSFAMGGVLKHALVYGVGTLLKQLVSFIMLPVYTRYLTPEDYGVMALVEMTLDVMALMAGAQLVLGIFRYYHLTDDPEEKQAVVSTAFLGLSGSYLMVGGLAILLAGWLSTLVFGTLEHRYLIQVAAVGLVAQSLPLVPLAFARVRDRSMLVVAASLATLVLGLSLNILFVVILEKGILGIFYSSLIANGIVGIGMAVWLVTRVGIHFSKRQFRSLLRYGVPMIGMQVATFAATFGDRYFLQATGDTAAVGLYNLAYRFGFLLSAIGFLPFDQVWGPKRFEIAKRSDRDTLLSKGFLFANLWLIWLALACSLFILDFFRILTTPAFFSASRFVHLILVAYIFQVWASVQDIGILISEKTEYLTLANWIAAGVALAGFAILIPPYGGMGAATATLISFFTRWVLTYRMSQRLWRVEYTWGPVLRLVALALVGALAGLALPPLPILVSIPVRAVILLAFTVLVWRLVLSAAERAQVEEKVRLYGGMAVAAIRARRARPGTG